MRLIFIIGLAVAVAACAMKPETMQEYSFVKEEYVTMPDDTYRVFDKPESNRMLVSSSIASATSQSFRATLLLKDDVPSKETFEATARQYLANSGRDNCRILDSYLLIKPQYEVKYDCAPLPVPSRKKQKSKRT
jgi:hypothetical protein